MVTELIQDVKKILPSCVIGAGGPEFGYYPEGYLEKLKLPAQAPVNIKKKITTHATTGQYI